MKQERKKRVLKLAIWTWSWVGSLALATFGYEFLWNQSKAVTLAAILLNLCIGIGMIIANRNLFNHFDELERKIHLESLAITLGLTVVVGLTYSLFDQTNIIHKDAEIGLLVGFIGITYLISLVVSRKKYL